MTVPTAPPILTRAAAAVFAEIIRDYIATHDLDGQTAPPLNASGQPGNDPS